MKITSGADNISSDMSIAEIELESGQGNNVDDPNDPSSPNYDPTLDPNNTDQLVNNTSTNMIAARDSTTGQFDSQITATKSTHEMNDDGVVAVADAQRSRGMAAMAALGGSATDLGPNKPVEGLENVRAGSFDPYLKV